VPCQLLPNELKIVQIERQAIDLACFQIPQTQGLRFAGEFTREPLKTPKLSASVMAEDQAGSAPVLEII